MAELLVELELDDDFESEELLLEPLLSDVDEELLLSLPLLPAFSAPFL